MLFAVVVTTAGAAELALLADVRQRVARERHGRRGIKADPVWAHRRMLPTAGDHGPVVSSPACAMSSYLDVQLALYVVPRAGHEVYFDFRDYHRESAWVHH